MSRECTALSLHRLSSLRVLGHEYPKTKCGLVTEEVDQFEFGARLKLFPDFLDLAGLAPLPQPHSNMLATPATDEKLGTPNFWAPRPWAPPPSLDRRHLIARGKELPNNGGKQGRCGMNDLRTSGRVIGSFALVSSTVEQRTARFAVVVAEIKEARPTSMF